MPLFLEFSHATIYFTMDSKRLKNLKQAIALSKRSYFHGTSGAYAEIMAEAILVQFQRQSGFRAAFNGLCDAREEVLKRDARASFLIRKSAVRIKDDVSHLNEFNVYRKLRPTNKSKKNFSVFVGKKGHYSQFFRYLDKCIEKKNWSPQIPPGSPRNIKSAFSVSRHSSQYIKLTHARPVDVPRILKHCEKLWAKALRSKTPEQATNFIAEFEWWFFAANPTGRCGASLGLCLSIILHLRTQNELPMRFMHFDWRSLSRELSDYRAWRIMLQTKMKSV